MRKKKERDYLSLLLWRLTILVIIKIVINKSIKSGNNKIPPVTIHAINNPNPIKSANPNKIVKVIIFFTSINEMEISAKKKEVPDDFTVQAIRAIQFLEVRD